MRLHTHVYMCIGTLTVWEVRAYFCLKILSKKILEREKRNCSGDTIWNKLSNCPSPSPHHVPLVDARTGRQHCFWRGITQIMRNHFKPKFFKVSGLQLSRKSKNEQSFPRWRKGCASCVRGIVLNWMNFCSKGHGCSDSSSSSLFSLLLFTVDQTPWWWCLKASGGAKVCRRKSVRWRDIMLAAHCQMVQENGSSSSCTHDFCFKIKQNLKVYE